MSMLAWLQRGDMPLFQLKFGVITLLLEKGGCGSNKKNHLFVSLMWDLNYTKLGTNCITGISHKVIHPTQMAFMQG